MPYFDRFDICEAWYYLEMYWNVGGILQERPSNQRRLMSCDYQLHRMQFHLRAASTFETLEENARDIYWWNVFKGLELLNPRDITSLIDARDYGIDRVNDFDEIWQILVDIGYIPSYLPMAYEYLFVITMDDFPYAVWAPAPYSDFNDGWDLQLLYFQDKLMCKPIGFEEEDDDRSR